MKRLLLLVGLTACTPVPPAEEPAKVASCSTDGLSDVVGKPYSVKLGEATRKRSGSRTMRVIRPGMAVTMDFRTDRLNIDLDEKNLVTRLHCG